MTFPEGTAWNGCMCYHCGQHPQYNGLAWCEPCLIEHARAHAQSHQYGFGISAERELQIIRDNNVHVDAETIRSLKKLAGHRSEMRQHHLMRCRPSRVWKTGVGIAPIAQELQAPVPDCPGLASPVPKRDGGGGETRTHNSVAGKQGGSLLRLPVSPRHH